MNTRLWIAQGIFGFAFIGAGYNHGFRSEQMRLQRGGEWVGAVPRRLLGFIALNLTLMALAAFVAYGRFVIAPQ